MNCANHPDIAATAFCRTCGKALCITCQRPAQGTVFCEDHAIVEVPPAAAYSPYTVPYGAPYGVNPNAGPSPGLAFLLGLIPGVGAIYNGQYGKGLIHVVILGLLISILNSSAAGGMEPLFGMLIPLWFFYMAFEAYHTAARRQRGETVDEFSSILPMQARGKVSRLGPCSDCFRSGFLMNSLELVRLYQILKYWPVFLIALGVYLLYAADWRG
ncbi:MAG: hypothetical protein WKF37_00530 [Bryobacteraceae bacterium]